MYKYLQAFRQFPSLTSYVMHRTSTARDDEVHLRAAVDWLLTAQRPPLGGYAHSFHLAYGWQPAYPETTGYIIPSLLEADRVLQDARIAPSVRSALAWLEDLQAPEGFYCDLHNRPQVFDTGQILIGFNYIAEHHPDLHPVAAALQRAADWLAAVQEADGAFVRFAYHNRPHAYYSRVGAALVKAGLLLDDAKLRQAGIRNLDWTVAQQQENGFFRHSSFDDQPAFLHTMIYIIEGLLDGYELANNARYYQSCLKFTDHLLTRPRSVSLPRSQYNEDFSIHNSHLCLTGLAQWATVCLRLWRLTERQAYVDEAYRVIAYLKTRQILAGHGNIKGALPGSVPIYGNYMRYAFPNWGVKFFMDSLLQKMKESRYG